MVLFLPPRQILKFLFLLTYIFFLNLWQVPIFQIILIYPRTTNKPTIPYKLHLLGRTEHRFILI